MKIHSSNSSLLGELTHWGLVTQIGSSLVYGKTCWLLVLNHCQNQGWLKPCSATRDSQHPITCRVTKNKCVQLHATQLTVFMQRWCLSNCCKMSLLLHLLLSSYTSTVQIKKKTAMEVPRSTSIKTDTWDIYVTLLNELFVSFWGNV